MEYKNYTGKINLKNKNFQNILNFYLFHCPTPGKSVRAKTFEQLGWKGSHQFAQLRRSLLKVATKNLKNNYHPCKKDELGVEYKKVSNTAPPEEYCIFLKHDKDTVMQSLFSAIRNALAHGSFNIKSCKKVRVYSFVNFDEYKKAEIVLNENTLLEWIKIVERGYQS